MDDLKYFDRMAATEVSCRNLPHWSQKERVQFVTFRLADSLPNGLLKYWHQLHTEWVEKHPQPWTDEEAKEYHRIIVQPMGQRLDSGHGCCILKDETARNILCESLEYNDGKTMKIYAYVIMPNHVHLLASPVGCGKIQEILAKVKRYTSRCINQQTAHQGTVWQREVFDRIVRGEYFFVKYLRYIKENPRYLPAHEFTLYISKDVREAYAGEI